MDLDEIDRMSPTTAKILLGMYAVMCLWWVYFMMDKTSLAPANLSRVYDLSADGTAGPSYKNIKAGGNSCSPVL